MLKATAGIAQKYRLKIPTDAIDTILATMHSEYRDIGSFIT